MLAGFGAFLNALELPGADRGARQSGRPESLRRPRWRSAAANRLDGQLAGLAHDHAAFVQGLARQRTLLERRFYVVVPAESAARLGWCRRLRRSRARR